jgi:electron transport complex protein RnfD
MLLSAVCDYTFVQIVRKEKYVWEGSPLVSGAILAMFLPPNTPIWMLILGVFFSCILTKQCFGGLGSNLFNPALAAKAFLTLMFPQTMSSFSDPILSRWQFDSLLYGPSSETSLTQLPSTTGLFEFMSGRYAGNIGTTCTIAILLGAVYLILIGLMRIQAPLTYLGVLCGGYFLLNDPAFFSVEGMLRMLLTDGFLFVAVFAMSDYSTTPTTSVGRLIFGAGSGFLTILLLGLGNPLHAVVFPVLFMNATTPILDLYFRPRLFARKGLPSGNRFASVRSKESNK